ncbi:MAG: hypothetical protein WAU32_09715, partial [Thermoanaerobaculia bacterium]
MTQAPLSTFGADRVEAGPGQETVLLCPVSKVSWAPRREKTLTTAAYPGTAVEWGGLLFEVRRAEPLADGGMRYVLAPWEEGHAIRRLERYDEQSELARARTREDLVSGVRKRRLSILLAPLAGLLPGAVQKDMESEFGAPSIAMTISSALPLFVVGFLGVFERFLGGLGAGLGLSGWLTPPGPIALYLFAESALRLGSAIAMGEPMGSFPVVFAYQAWREAREPKPAAGQAAAPEDAARDASDRFRMLEPLLSLLSPAEQEVLIERFRFEPVRWGKLTAAILLLLAGTNFLVALVNLAAGAFGPTDFVWLVAGGFLSWEQIRR